MSIGSPSGILSTPDGREDALKMKNLEPMTLQYAEYLPSSPGFPAVVFHFQTPIKGDFRVDILFIDKIRKVEDAWQEMKRFFTDIDLKKGVDRRFQFFWEYAIHGEVMDGMHANQLTAALGMPLGTERTGDREIREYVIQGKPYRFELIAGELVLPEGFRW
ncbi:MAG: hypothetical protein MZV64_30450 [Ignavibacteriales bacterium]|nr:hypothetical protein [Ignavibacteriales bacterium]